MAAFLLRSSCALLALATLAPAVELADFKGVDLSKSEPQVQFDLPRSVVFREVTGAEDVAQLAPGERLVVVELPVSVLVRQGEVSRVEEVVIEVDGASAGLVVHDYEPATRLESEFAREIEVQSTSESNRHLEASLGGKFPLGDAVAQITPGVSIGRGSQEIETEKLARRPPKQAIVVSGPIHQRQGVLFKFRPSSQTTLEGEHPLRLTFIAPADWTPGTLDVRCHAQGERKVLFVKHTVEWGNAALSVQLRQPGTPRGELAAKPFRQTTAKPVLAGGDKVTASRPTPTAEGPIWKARNTPTP